MKSYNSNAFSKKILLQFVRFIILFCFLTANEMYSQSLWVGMSKEDLIYEMGNPKSSMSRGGKEVLFYPHDVKIEVRNNKVVSIKGMTYDYSQQNAAGSGQSGVWGPEGTESEGFNDGVIEEVDPDNVEHLIGNVSEEQILPPGMKVNEVEEEVGLPRELAGEDGSDIFYGEPGNDSESVKYPEFTQGELPPDAEAFMRGEASGSQIPSFLTGLLALLVSFGLMKLVSLLLG